MTTRTIEQIATLIAPVLEKYTLTASQETSKIVIRDKKNVIIGSVGIDGTVDRKMSGRQALMGALIRNDIVAALA